MGWLEFIHFRDLRLDIATGNLTFCYGKSPFLMGKLTIPMAMFNSYFDISRLGIPAMLGIPWWDEPWPIPMLFSPGFLNFVSLKNGDRFFDTYINSQWPFQEPNLEVPTIYRPLVRAMQGDIPPKIWLYMVQYPQFRYLAWPLEQGGTTNQQKRE